MCYGLLAVLELDVYQFWGPKLLEDRTLGRFENTM